jgi:hypothetical protein
VLFGCIYTSFCSLDACEGWRARTIASPENRHTHPRRWRIGYTQSTSDGTYTRRGTHDTGLASPTLRYTVKYTHGHTHRYIQTCKTYMHDPCTHNTPRNTHSVYEYYSRSEHIQTTTGNHAWHVCDSVPLSTAWRVWPTVTPGHTHLCQGCHGACRRIGRTAEGG